MARKLIREEGLLCGRFTDQVIPLRFGWYNFLTPSFLAPSNCALNNLSVLLQAAALAQPWPQQ